MTAVQISELRAHVGETVTVRGWVVTTRSSGKIAFVVLRDGIGRGARGPVQEGGGRTRPGQRVRRAHPGSERGADGRGAGRARARRAGSSSPSAASSCSAPVRTIPITPKEHGTTFLFEHRHLWLRSRRQVAIARVRHEVEQAIRDFFYQEGFTLVDTPILTGAIGEEAGNLFATDYFDLGKAYLAQTGQLYVEAAAAAFGKVYCFGPTFRAEKSKTRRHLTEFWMVEPEVAFNDSDANMRLQEEFVSYIVARALERRKEELKELERDTAPLERVQPPFPRITYTDAVARLNAARLRHRRGATTSAATTRRCWPRSTTGRVFVFNYPKEVKAFYMKENPDDPRTVLNNDCLAPEGYGEIIGGSQREDDYDKLLAPHPGAGARSRGVRLVPRPAEVRHLRALGLRPGPRADRGVDLRAARTSARRSRFRGRSTGCIPERSPYSPGLHLVPQPVQRAPAPRPSSSIPRASASRLDLLEPLPELPVGAVERDARLARRPCAPDSPPRTAGRRSRRSVGRSGAARGVFGIAGSGAAASAGRRASSASTSASSSRTLASGPAASGQSNPTDGRALLQPIGPEQRRQRRHDAGERPPSPLPPLDPLPRLGRRPGRRDAGWRRRILRLELVGDVVGGELAALLGDHELKGQMEQQVAQLVRGSSSASPSPSAWSSSSTSSTR